MSPRVPPPSAPRRARPWKAALVLGLLALGLNCTDSPEPTSQSGDAVADATAADAATVGAWTGTVCAWPPHIAIHAHVLSNGRVLFWPGEEGHHRGSKGSQQAFVWDPIACTAASVPNTRTDMFCSGHTAMRDGRLIVVGGHFSDNHGRRDASFFDPVQLTWSRGKPMAAGRWYPTSVTLPNGDVLVVGGSDENAAANAIPEVLGAKGGWVQLTGAQLTLPLYPRLFVAPDGRVFMAGPGRLTRYLNTANGGSWQSVGNFQYGGDRDYGTAVMYAPGRILAVGGNNTPTNTAETIDLNSGAPAWQYTGAMARPRRQHNATILPDGTVLVTGGTSGAGFNNESQPELTAELWNPATGQWTTLAAMATPRLYHSTALLLPDGRVLSAGGGRCGGCTQDYPNAELYSPPYLFKGARPTITEAPAQVGYGQSFTVRTPEAASIARVTLVRLSSVTHAFNGGQRFDELSFTPGAGTLAVTAPSDGRRAPPGHYMLFVLDANGVPSVARVIRIG